MKPLLKTLAIVAFVILVSQTVRHAYMLWLQPRGSVLDKYDQPVKSEIATAVSLEDLLRRYEPLRKQADLAKQELQKTNKESSVSDFATNQKEPFKSEQMLREAITEWEARSREIRELRTYCLIALVLFAFGLAGYLKLNHWLGVTLLITSFAEFIYWTSPTFIGPATREFDRLLVNKLVFSAVSLVLLAATIWSLRIFAEKDQQSA